MTTGQDLVDAAATFLGEPYSTAPGRTSPTSGYKDCSGLIAAAYQVATGHELGAYVSVTIYDLCASEGLGISRDEALAIPGACLLIPDNPYDGWGPNGHIGFSTGDGFTIEATPAARGGVQRLPNTYQPWGPAACLLPGINYGSDQEDAMTLDDFAAIAKLLGVNAGAGESVVGKLEGRIAALEAKLAAGGGVCPPGLADASNDDLVGELGRRLP